MKFTSFAVATAVGAYALVPVIATPAVADPGPAPSPKTSTASKIDKIEAKRPSYVPKAPSNAPRAIVNLGPDCLGIYEGPFKGGDYIWGTVGVYCETERTITTSSQLWQGASKLDEAYYSESNVVDGYVVTQAYCAGTGTRYYRHEEYMAADAYSFGHYDALNITC